ncbi:MAG: hypothetical protein NTV32_08160 [Gammaproteobacteria bacterium]|nr:hypothetical protein [Gammaproteobacteria bacterium]
MDLRQLTNPNDPRPTIKLPAAMYKQIEGLAKKDKRSVADEVNRRIGRTFRELFEVEYHSIACELKPILEEMAFDAKHNKRISSEMVEALQESADHEGHSLDMEVALRLGATLEQPETFEAGDLLSKILGKRRTQATDDLAIQNYEIRALYYYERDKLERFIRSMDILPKTVKESFQHIDIEIEGPAIIEKMEWEDKKNKAEEDSIIKRDWNEMKKRILVIAADNKPANEQVIAQVIEQAKPSKPDEVKTKGVVKNEHDNKKNKKQVHKIASCHNVSGEKGHPDA